MRRTTHPSYHPDLIIVILTRQLSPEDISKAAALYALSRDQSSLCKLSKDEIAEMVATKTVKGEDGDVGPYQFQDGEAARCLASIITLLPTPNRRGL